LFSQHLEGRRKRKKTLVVRETGLAHGYSLWPLWLWITCFCTWLFALTVVIMNYMFLV